jgi:hypothetical protein
MRPVQMGRGGLIDVAVAVTCVVATMMGACLSSCSLTRAQSWSWADSLGGLVVMDAFELEVVAEST